MAEVRAGVDELDEKIVEMLAARFRFMDAAARVKQERSQVRDEERKAAILDRVRALAISILAPADLVVELYDELIEASIRYEYGAFDRLGATTMTREIGSIKNRATSID